MQQMDSDQSSTHSEKQNKASGEKRADFFVFPLSFQQEALWFLDQLEPGLPVYNLNLCFKANGCLDIAILENALNRIVDRHESLRTGFKIIDGEVSQVIFENVKVDLEYQEIDNEAPDRYKEALDLAKKYSSTGFDLNSRSLFRPYTIKYGEQQYLMVFLFNHIIFDGWSGGLFNQELTHIYNTLLAGKQLEIKEPEVQYADFVIWQRKWFDGVVREEQMKFWRKQLADNPAPLELPTDMVRPTKQNFKGEYQSIHIPKPLVQSLRDLSAKEQCTLFMTILSAFKVLLYRYTGQEDISVGSPTAGRDSQELEASIGYYANTIVFRSDLSGNPTFREFLKMTRDNVLNIFDYQLTPFDKLVEELKPDRDLSRNPFFQVMLAWQPAHGEDCEFQGLSVEHIRIGTGTSKFDLSFELDEGPTGITGFIEYNSELFKPDIIGRFVGNFEVLLNSLVGNLDQKIGNLEILGKGEKEFLIEKINATDAPFPLEKCIHQLFEQQALQIPDDIAVRFHDSQLTYAELNEKANKLAHYLKENGAGADKLVGIYLDRSLEMVISLLGILKSGSAYLPLDPMFPHDRLQYMLEDANASILFTQDKLRNSFQGYRDKVICIDTDWESIANCSGENLKTAISSRNL